MVTVKRTRRKNIFRSLLGSMNRFLSILFIVALGSGFMAGLAATSPDMYETADQYMDDYALYDVDIKSMFGFSQQDADAVAALEGVSGFFAARVTDLVLESETQVTYTSRVFAFVGKDGSMPLNRVKLTEGRMPQKHDECVIQNTTGKYLADSPKIGSRLSLSDGKANTEVLKASVRSDVLTVVGVVEAPMCLGIESEPTNVGSGSITMNVYTTDDYFTYDFYTDLYVTFADAVACNTFGDAYKDEIHKQEKVLLALAAQRVPVRSDEVRRELQEQLGLLRPSLAMLQQLVGTEENLTKDAAERAAQLEQTAEILKASGREEAVALAELLKKTAEEIRAGTERREDRNADVRFLSESIAEAEERLAAAESGSWIVRTRMDSTGFSSYSDNVGKVAALSKVFPVFFFVVALLVALTTMTRLVEERRAQNGTLRALGFSSGQILREYLGYSTLSSVLGCLLGFSVGFRLFPQAISSAYGMLYFLPQTVTPIRLDLVLTVALVTVGSILLATWFSCYGECRACPARLMQPKAPAAGKRIWLEHIPLIWNRLSFTHKVTCRNLFRYKKRFIMTIIGVSGCTALLVTGFGLKDSINDIVDKQFGEIYRYELMVAADSAEAIRSDEALHAFLTDSAMISDYLAFGQESGKVRIGDASDSVTLLIPEDVTRLSSFVTLRHRQGKHSLSLSQNGVILTEKLCETLQIREGDTVTLENGNGIRAEVCVIGIAENYVASFAYLSAESYRSAFGTDADFRVALCCVADGADGEVVSSRALESDHALYARSTMNIKKTFNNSIKSINSVILVLILSAGLLSVVVLYNLTNVNICERRKELATIRVLGFHEWEAERYIFRETNVLSILGSLVGLLVGVGLHAFVVRTVEVNQIMFGRTIYPQSFVFALLISLLFTFAVNLLMRRSIRKVDMVEAMKAND